ncbi:CPBP family intramembrane metalloprotease [Anaerocolumna aminovalerica]|uniref:CPBP family intramembrane glutamic endopeptidase n=1 Tax=Anaerocolumna aminovalerica TaxID=1527 RepID=UPI001C0F12F7|nr:type II CAAX endopeptidase family protein [Anaerocolumna aminovalerica]MBU5334676.1 CPBP family intramembrane metalloprotease [Anaerocolumna aminovalerica]
MNRVRTINFVFFATVLLSLVGNFINQWIFNYTDNYFIILLVSQIILVLPSAIYLALSKNSIGKAIRFNKIKGSNIVLIIIFSYLISPLMTLINAISMLFVKNDTAGLMENIVTNNGFIISLFIIAFIPCVLEETVYRGIFYNEYRKVSPIKGILLSAFLFGIMHMNFNQFSYAFIMGIIFALLIEATDSILSTMIVHFFINGNSVLIMFLYPKMMEYLEKVYGSGYFNSAETIEGIQANFQMDFSLVLRTYAFPALVGSVLAFIVYRAIAKNSGRWTFIKGLFKPGGNMEVSSFQDTGENNLSYQQKKWLMTASLLIGILVCVTLMIWGEIISQMPSPSINEVNNTSLSIYINHILS